MSDDQQLYDLLFDRSHEFPDENEIDDPDYDYEDVEESDEFDAEEPPATRTTSLIGKDGKYEWFKKPLERKGRAAPITLQHYLPTSRGRAANVKTPLEAWDVLFDKAIIDKIFLHTQQRIIAKREGADPNLKQSYQRDTSVNEIRAFFGLLYYAGVTHSSKLSTAELWEKKSLMPVFRSVMSARRFEFLKSCITFDDDATREARQYSDNFAPIRAVWNRFVKNCTDCYTPFTNMTIDEQLLSFRGNTKGFKVYMPAKPAKYGIKIMMMNDAKTFYMFNAIPYSGRSAKEVEEERKKKEDALREKEEEAKRKEETKRIGGKHRLSSEKKTKEEAPPAKKGKSEERKRTTTTTTTEAPSIKPTTLGVAAEYVKALSRPIYGTKRNVTVDNYFSSIPLFDEMLTENITMVGTLRKNKREIPPSFLWKKNKGSSSFAFDKTKTLISYSQTDDKNVLFLSSNGLFYNEKIDATTQKPEIIDFYNHTKTGTDTFDMLCGTYTTARGTRRWTMRVLYGMLDQAGYNAQILYLYSPATKQEDRPRLIRRKFLKDLSLELMKPLLFERLTIPQIRSSVRALIKMVLGLDEEGPVSVRSCNQYDDPNLDESLYKLPKVARCALCSRKDDVKTTHKCPNCNRPTCNRHRVKICVECSMEKCKKKKK